MPCHTTSWFVGYPDLASGPGPYQIRRKWGISDSAMDPTRENTYRFVSRFLGEMAALFPDEVFHVGGDECSGKEWNANPRIQRFMRTHAINDNAALQAYFTARVEKIVAAHGKVMEGWDEVLQPNTPKDIIIQSWRGQQSLVDAIQRGYRVVLSTGYYIDLNQPAAEHYAVDPLGPSEQTLSSQERQRVLGGEATMWTVFEDSENIDCHIWPRTAAIAERLWSPQDVRDVESMYIRLALASQWLEYHGLQHNASYPQMLLRMTGNPDPVALRVLGDVMQPVRFHTRESLGKYDVFTPLNRLVDALPPESETARRFSALADAIVSESASPKDIGEAQNWLHLWRDNDGKLQPQLPQSQLTQELIPVSTNLRQVAEIGLEALTYLENRKSAPAAWVSQQIAFLRASEQPQADLLDMVAPAVIKLVQATSH
jgi:hexosaminidase